MTQAVDLANAINNFVVGCKQDGIWDPIKACCIMAAWDGLSGALYPLKGPAPTNYNFVAGDYNRETGLKGDGSTKYLDSNRNNNADPQDNRHLAVQLSSAETRSTSFYLYLGTSDSSGPSFIARRQSGNIDSFKISDNTIASFGSNDTGFTGVSRTSGSGGFRRKSNTTLAFATSSVAPKNQNIGVFANISPAYYTNARIAFYSIGESLDLAALDTRVSDLITAIGAAMP